MRNKAIWVSIAATISLAVHAETADRFTLTASYKNAALTSLNFDYRDNRKLETGFSADDKRIPSSACYARIPGSDNLTAYLNTIKNKPLAREIDDTRRRMQDAVARNKLDIWQEALCVGPVPYPVTSNGNGGKWSSVPVILNGERQGAWNDVFSVVQKTHLYSITVHPAAIKPQ